MTHEELHQKLGAIPDQELIDKASQIVVDLCKTGARSFTMSVPVRVDDTDMILTEPINRFKNNSKSNNTLTKQELVGVLHSAAVKEETEDGVSLWFTFEKQAEAILTLLKSKNN